ncbi:hypothetical protein ASD19_02575 [Microbacterium sp. Root53]|uniref:hypothetical protein n=1 Tax=Microbacterium sp. Root53 TaxID=1736553 RepID=UPI0006F2D409|nr:hypothetical protein [Microbacterium sp. Root53]KQZ04923.1 hypothetical protein ASD19_02575 [Microbacterium sp. Root53]
MNRIGATYLLATVLAIGLLGVGFVWGVKPSLDAAAAATTERIQIESQNQLFEMRIAQLSEARDGLAAHEDRLAELQRAVPADGDYDDWLAELDRLAAATGVSITQVTVADSQPLATEAPPAAPPASDGANPDGAAAPAAQPEAAPSAGAPAALLAIPVQIGVNGPAAGVRGFIRELQGAERLTLASRFAFSSSDEQPDVLAGTTGALIDGLIWVLPE